MKVKLFDGFNNVVLRTGDDPTGVGRLVVVWASSGWGRWWRRWRCRDVGQFIDIYHFTIYMNAAKHTNVISFITCNSVISDLFSQCFS